MPTFVHPSLFWIFGLPTLGVVAIPVLIHLINMMRHRRVEWAAMEFLLQSQKKNRTWVMMKQLLLLLLRMATLAAIVFLAAQPLMQSRLGALLGSVRTHHIVLLDDSFSMSDRWEDTEAFAQAKQVVERIGTEASRQTTPQLFTLLRFSQIGRIERAAEPDMLKQQVGGGFHDKLSELLGKLSVSQTAVEPGAAVSAIGQLLGIGEGERRIVYIVSDFRTRQWDNPVDLRAALLRLDEAHAEIHLVACVDHTRPNLAIQSLIPSQGVRAAGVPWFMEVAVQNFGPSTVHNVTVVLGEDGHGRPAVMLPEIPPGKTAKERFLVQFPNAGRHEITARLESDAIEVDNHRYATLDLPENMPVLLIDGDSEARDARYLSWALAPGGSVRTGIQPEIETPRYLSLKPLDRFRAINIANVDRLEASAIDALEKYVAAGGGAVFFVGERTQAKFINDALYRNGKGLFPTPLGHPTELPIDRLDPAPDIQTSDHSIFRVFSAKRNTFLQKVTVERYYTTAENWLPPEDSTVQVLARLRNGAPLVVEQHFGKGRVIVILTSASPGWNNWAQNPSYVVVAQDLQAYLAGGVDAADSHVVGHPLTLTLDPAAYRPEIQFLTPASGNNAISAANASPDADGMLVCQFPDTDLSGFYEARLTRADGAAESRRYAVNVDPAEGNLAMFDSQQLASRLEGIHYRYDEASAFQTTQGDASGRNMSEALLIFLIILLLAEQLLAWSASYHTHTRGMQPAKGGVH